MALPNIYNIEGFTWCGTSVSVLLSRYNQPQSSGGTSIGAGQGRFSGNALGVNGGGYTQNFNIPAGPFAAPIRMGFAVKSSNWPTPGMLMAFGDSGSGLPGGHQNVYAACGVDALGRLTILQWPFNLLNQGVLQATGTHILQNNSYYYIEFEIMGITAASVVNVYLDGVLEATATFDTRGAGGLSGNVYEFYLCCPQAGAQYYFCDGYVADTLLGPSRAVDATPTGDGALSQWTPSVAGPHYLLVNEEPPDGDTTYVSSATPGQIDLYTFAPLASSPAAILGVQVAFYARKDDIAARTIAPEVRSGGTNYAGTTQPALTTTYLDIYLEVYNADPHTAVAWLPAGLNAAQFGVNEVS
jgi:hypothetical protein